MPNTNFDELLASSIRTGGLNQEHIAQILNFKIFGNKSGYLHLPGLPIGDIPATPTSRDALGKPDDASEKCLLQATSLLGQAIGYPQESNGAIINNFFPHQAHSKSASSDSYDTELDLHTENAFHAVLPDYLLLLCLRQDPLSEAITYITSINAILERLDREDVAYFFNEHYNFLSDYSTTAKNCRLDIGKHQSVLYGDPNTPFFRFDPQFMVAQNAHAKARLQHLNDIAWAVKEPVKLATGDLLIIDNRKTAHARSPFTALLDGSDRWIQRTFAITGQHYYTEMLGSNQRVYELVTEL